MDPTLPLSRRRFLQAAGWTAVGVTVTFSTGCSLVLPALPTLARPDEDSGIAWLQIREDGRCAMFSPRSEMGQHATTALAQIAAEELNIAVEDVVLALPTTVEIPPVLLTSGSMSMALYSEPVARAAAGLREVLRGRAAAREGVAPAAVRDAAGGFELPDGRVLTHGEIAAGAPVVLDADALPEAPLYTFDPERAHRQVGRAAPLFQAREIVTGGPLYAGDVRLPEMLHGRAVLPPAHDAALARVEVSRARALPGIVEVVVDLEENFVGVVGETPGAVDEAIDLVEAAWSLPSPIDPHEIERRIDVDAALARGSLEHTPLGDAMDAQEPWDLDLRFDVQIQSHVQQEPRAAVARIGASAGEPLLEIWTGSQDPFAIQRLAAREAGLAPGRVVVHAMRLGGGFGGREMYEVERDALRLASAVGRPVKVQWSRADEFRAAKNRPPSSHRLRLRVDAQGRISDWWHALVSGHIVFSKARVPGWLRSAAGLFVADLGVARGAEPPYDAARKRVEIGDVELPIDLGTWRSLGATPNTFAIESAIDELARGRGVDPVGFRLSHLPAEHDRLATCLRKVRGLAQRVPLPRAAGHGRGFACGIYEERSFVAAGADVHVDPDSGRIRVLRMCCVQDVGLAINPDQLRAQIEGNMIWGIGTALLEELAVGSGEIATRNLDTYRIPRMGDAPSFEIEIVDSRSERPAAAGETALIVAPPAIANAVRDASGQRLTRLPLRLGARS